MLTRDSDKKAEKQAAKDAKQAAEQAEKERQEFLASFVGQARTAFEAGDQFFQFAAPGVAGSSPAGPYEKTLHVAEFLVRQ